MAQILIESKIGSLQPINESVENKRAGVLGRLKGPCAKCDEPTRNGRCYSRKLWESVIDSPTFKEYIDNKVLYGELNHPTDRIETDITKVAIALSDIEIQPDGTLIGTFDILDTPNGHILKALCDYGSHPGVSSRGGGDVVIREGQEYVDEGSYDFVAFDVVTLPAVKMARPSVVESVEYKNKVSTLHDNINNVINEAKTRADIISIKSIIEKLNIPEKTTLLENMDKKLKTFDGENSSTVLNDLTEALNKVETLEKENAQLTEQVTSGSIREKNLNEELQKTKGALSRIQENKKVLGNSKTITENLNTRLNSSIEANKKLRKELARVNSQLNVANSKLDEAEVKANSDKISINLLTESKETLRKKLQVEKGKVNDLEEQLKNTNDAILEQKSKMPAIVEQKVAVKTKDYAIQLQQLNENVSSLQAKYNGALTEKKTLQHNLSDMIKKYITCRCNQTGISESQVYDKLGKKIVIENIDKVIDSAVDFNSRINALPFELNSNSIVGARLVSEQVEINNRPKNAIDDDLTGLKQLLSLKNKK
jgi:hypothetical protein